MASTTKKGSENTKAKRRRPVVKTSPAKQAQTIAELRQELEARNRDLAASLQRESATSVENVRLSKELQDCKRQLTEALEQQTATSEILGVIASSPTDVQPVLDVVAESAARLCDATDAVVSRLDDATLRLVAHYGSIPGIEKGEPLVFSRNVVHGRAILDRQTIHVNDIAAEIETYPDSKQLQQLTGTRTILAVPLLREDDAVGAIVIRRPEVRPFLTSRSLSSKPSPTKL